MAAVDREARTICPLCEAACGVSVALSAGVPGRVRGDRDHVVSKGFICPKGAALTGLHLDTDRQRRPLRRRGASFEPVDWEEAFGLIDERLRPITAEHGRDAVGLYLGNPAAHSLDLQLYGRHLVRSLRTANVFTPSTTDSRPKELSSVLMFGALSIPVPDVDRTDLLVILGANPLQSNGSLASGPDWPGRLRALRSRGGRLIVVDPCRTRTAEVADRHIAIRPGADAYLLAAVVHVLFAEGLVRLGRLQGMVNGIADVERAVRRYSPDRVATITGVDPATTVDLARELSAADRACVYGRVGTSTQRFGTLASWLVDVINVLTGHLDREGCAMFSLPATGSSNTRGTPGRGRGTDTTRRSRVSGRPDLFGERSVLCLAEEIETPGEGRIRALITVAGNPVLSAPDASRIDAALHRLDFMVSVDYYLNETTRHADVLLPVPSPYERAHYDTALSQFTTHNVAVFAPALLPVDPAMLAEWRTVARLALIAEGQGASADVDAWDDRIVDATVRRLVADPSSRILGCDPVDVLRALGTARGPERILELLLRSGPYGDGCRGPHAHDAALSLDRLREHPQGIDLGPLAPRLPDMLRTPSGLIELAPSEIVADIDRFERRLVDHERAPRRPELVLVGRRHLRSNNSWMHNIDLLARGPARCTLQVHPDDAERIGVTDGGRARVTAAVGSLSADVEVTDRVAPGVVSLPHGWGHDLAPEHLTVAARRPGVNVNLLTDPGISDEPSGTAVLNGIPVDVERCEASPITNPRRALPAPGPS